MEAYFDTYMRAFYPPTPVLTTPEGNIKIALEGLKPGARIFYYAAKPSVSVISTPKKAYGKLQNSGVARVTATGRAIITLDCPGIYLSMSGEALPRHVHYCYWSNDAWATKIYTHSVSC